MTPIFTIALASTDWDQMVQSMQSAFDGTDHTIKLLIALGILTVLSINLRLARWITKKSPPTP